MDNKRETILASIGLRESDFPLEKQSDNSYYSIRFQTEEIIILEIVGELSLSDSTTINAFFTEYNYQSSLRNALHNTYVICDLYSISSKMYHKISKSIEQLMFVQSIVYKPNKKSFNSIRRRKNSHFHYSQSLDEALLYVFTKKEQNIGVYKTDYYTNFITIWTEHYTRNYYKNTNLRVIQSNSWSITLNSPFFYSSIDVIEGNIFIINMIGFVSNIAIDRMHFLIKKICADLNVAIPGQKLIFIIDARKVRAVSYNLLQAISSFIMRLGYVERAFVIPSGIVQSFVTFYRVVKPRFFSNWILCSNVTEATNKATEAQFEININNYDNDSIQQNQTSKKIPTIFDDIYFGLIPLLSLDILKKTTNLIHNPKNLKEILNNIVYNIKANIEEYSANEINPSNSTQEIETLLNVFNQSVLLCSQTQILWANNYAYKTWGFRPNSLNNQPLSVLIELSELSGILSQTNKEFDFINLTTYHFEGHKIQINGKRVFCSNTNGVNTYYLVFN